MSAALWNGLVPWRGPLERLVADTRLPAELVQLAISERSVATLSATFALISLVISVMLFRAQGKTASAKFDKRVRAAMSYAPNSKDDLQKIAQSNLPYPYLLAAPVCLGCALVYAYFGFQQLSELSQVFSAPVDAANSDSLAAFFAAELPRMQELVFRHRCFAGFFNIGFLLGMLLVVLRLRIPRIWVYAGMVIACQCGAMYLLDTSYLDKAKTYLTWLQNIDANSSIPRV